MCKNLVIIGAILLIASNGAIAETLYPSGYNIACDYSLNSQSLETGDTLVITRTIANDEYFELTGLYLSDNLPSEFSIVSHSVRINNDDISDQFQSNISPSVVDGYNTCEWLVDDPEGDPNYFINTLQSLTLELKVTCETPGEYQLPFHACSFYGNNTGFYATDNAIIINITNPVDTIPPAAIGDLEAITD